MKKAWIVTVVALLALYGCWQLTYPSGSWRYKLTLVVDDNGKQVTGSSVVEIHIRQNPRLTPEMGDSITVKGEATAVDLGAKGVLFSLLTSETHTNYGHDFVVAMFPPPLSPTHVFTTRDMINYYTHLKEKRDVPFDKLPMLVRFREPNDQMTVEKVSPDDLEKAFGSGVKMVSATIEMTNEPVTTGIEEKLPWLRGLKGGYLGGGFTSRNAPLNLQGGYFKAGVP